VSDIVLMVGDILISESFRVIQHYNHQGDGTLNISRLLNGFTVVNSGDAYIVLEVTEHKCAGDDFFYIKLIGKSMVTFNTVYACKLTRQLVQHFHGIITQRHFELIRN